MYLAHSEFGKKNPCIKYVSSHILTLSIELHLVRFGLGASYIWTTLLTTVHTFILHAYMLCIGIREIFSGGTH